MLNKVIFSLKYIFSENSLVCIVIFSNFGIENYYI